MITFLCRAYAPDECRSDQYNGSAYFADVPDDHWANTTIGWAFENGITSGVGNGLFGMGQTVTREQTMAFLYRAEGTPDTGTLGTDHYDDVPTNSDAWYQAPIGWAYSQGITGGTATNTFGFRSTPSREETMLFMCRTFAPAICPSSREPVAPTTGDS
ncbi:MAG: S-layer homology domain-containing protein [bacterium]|nr:S-layer homology domain-containing protein [bacterium]MDE0501922.1 S-layer homology domain-containing protein [bacterium]